MNADQFVRDLQALADKILSAKPNYPQSTVRSAQTWTAIRAINPAPDRDLNDDIADLLARFYISPVVVGEISFATPWPGMRRIRFATFKDPSRKAIHLYVDTYESLVYQAPNAWDTQTSIDQNSNDFLDCLYNYAYYLSLRTTQQIMVTSQLRSLESGFIERIRHISGYEWWLRNIVLPR